MEVIYFGIFGTLALAALASGTGAFLGSTWIVRKFPANQFALLLMGIVVAGVIDVAFSGRVLRLDQFGLAVDVDAEGSSHLASMLLRVGIVFYGCSCIAAHLLEHAGKVHHMAARDMFVAILVFYVAYCFLPAAFGRVPSFQLILTYPLLILAAFFFTYDASARDPLPILKVALGSMVVLSLIAAALRPELALQPGYRSLIPGFNSRLWGITAHANLLGSICATLLIIEVAEPSRSQLRHWLLLICSFVALVLTQSKTALLSAIVAMGVLFAWRFSKQLAIAMNAKSSRSSVGTAVILAVFLVLAALFFLAFIVSDTTLIDVLEKRLNRAAMGDLSTASGRPLIWGIAFREGMDSPIFGYGPGIWSVEYRYRIGLLAAAHAHNQILQVFSRAGIVGLLALLWMAIMFVRYAIRGARPSRGGSLAVLAVLLTRSVFEVPVQLNSVLGGEYIAFMACVFYLTARGAQPVNWPLAAVAPVPVRRQQQLIGNCR